MLFAFVTLVSKILIILSVTGLIFNWIRGGIDEDSAILRFLPKKFGSVKLIGVFFIGLIILSLNSIFFYAEPGMSYLVQYPWDRRTPFCNLAFIPDGSVKSYRLRSF